MYSTKKDIDAHVRTALGKINSESERNLRGLTIAKLYFKINEYSTAEQYINAYLSVQENNDQAHKLLGLCYQRLKSPDKALLAFQRSLQLNLKQPDVLIEVCKLLLEDDKIHSNKAKYWYELAESENVKHDAVFALRLKLMSDENLNINQMESILQKEISNQPNAVQLHVRLIQYYIEQKQILNAFKYVQKLEMQQKDEFYDSDEWYNAVWLVLSKYAQMPNNENNWDFWLLTIICLERLVRTSLLHGANTILSSGSCVVEMTNHLFNLDQHLFQLNSEKLNGVQKDFLDLFMDHFRGQLLLHAVTLIFKRELLQNDNKWKETVQMALPLMLQAVQIKPFNCDEQWMKHIDGQSKQLILLWHREASFRCAQMGRTLLSCIDNVKIMFDGQKAKEKNAAQMFESQFVATSSNTLFQNSDDLLAQARRTCSDPQWRRNIFTLLFSNMSQKVKEQSSFLVKSNKLFEPLYELPSIADLEKYEETTQYLRPQSLQHIVYSCLCSTDLSDVRISYFNALPFSTENLSFCGAESLNQLDVDSFLYAATIQAQRNIVVERQNASNKVNAVDACLKPLILPFANIKDQLCTEEQAHWWNALYIIYKNLSNGKDLAELRATLQYGIEVVRGINGPKMDMAIVFKIAKIFVTRSQRATKPLEKSYLENRAEAIYRNGLNMLKLHHKGVLEPFRKFFKYAQKQSTNIEKQMFSDAEEGVSYLAGRYFKRSEYEDFIEELVGVQLPFSTYLQAEAYRKLDELTKTPRSSKRFYLHKFGECLHQSLALLKNSSHLYLNHPLNSIIPGEIERLQQSAASSLHETSPLSNNFNPYNNSSTYEDAEGDIFGENISRSRRELTATAAMHHHQQEMENLVKQMANTLVLLKEEIIETIKPEIQTLRKEMTSIKGQMENKDTLKSELQTVSKEISSVRDKMSNLEDVIRKVQTTPNPPSRDDANNVLEDLYIFDDAMQHQMCQAPQSAQTSNVNNLQGHQCGGSAGGSTFVNQQGRLSSVCNTLNMNPAYNNPSMYLANAANYPPLNFYGQSNAFMMPPTILPGQATNQQHHGPIVTSNQPYLDKITAGNFNFNAITQAMPLLPPNVPPESFRSNNVYNMLQISAQAVNSTSITDGTIPHPPLPSVLTNTSKTSVGFQLPPHGISSTPHYNLPVITQSNVEKDIPVNVVITSSDPIPHPNNTITQYHQQQPTLSVNIPSHHIKHSVISSVKNNTALVVTSTLVTKAPSTYGNINTTSTSAFNYKNAQMLEAPQCVSSSIEESSTTKRLSKPGQFENSKSDLQADFNTNTSLSEKIDVGNTEDEKLIFCHRAKLFRCVDKEWIDRGIGDIKILKNEKGSARILMNCDGTLKVIANHKITPDMILTVPQNESKGFIWVANDYSDGELRLETFLIRFKYAEIAQQFKKDFNSVQMQLFPVKPLDTVTTQITANTPFSMTKLPFNITTSTPITAIDNTTTTEYSVFGKPDSNADSKGKTLFSGNGNKDNAFLKFSINNQPNVGNTTAMETVTTVTAVTKSFPHFTFGKQNITTTKTTDSINTTTNSNITNSITTNNTNLNVNEPSSFANIFNNLNKSNIEHSNMGVSNLNKSTNSETEDDYVPTAQFKPVIPLPDLIEVNTGEENEIVLFEHRAKLLRFDKEAGEWKERGLGDMKILQDKNDSNKVRLLMRREIVHKLCCNQRLYKDTAFKYAANKKTALTWAAPDFSENELSNEVLTVRFKTEEICKQFYDCILQIQEKMSIDVNDKNMKNADKENDKNYNRNDKYKNGELKNNDFGDTFKPKPGSWACNGCYVTNTSKELYCAACNAPKDGTKQKNPITSVSNIFNTNSTSSFTFGFPSLTMNTISKSTESATATETTSNTTSAVTQVTDSKTGVFGTGGFGDKFKPQTGSWNCKDCLLCNSVEVIYCKACNAPKNDTVPVKENNSNIFNLDNTSQKFQFGFNTIKTDSTPVKGFTFTSEKTAAKNDKDVSFAFKSTSVSNNDSIATTAITTQSSQLGKAEFVFKLATSVPEKSTVTSSITTTDNTEKGKSVVNSFSLDRKEFNFTMKPKSPGKISSKSPLKLTDGGGDADCADSEAADTTNPEEEENSTYFTPIIPLPDKVETITGEEDEELLYIHRAKLYRFKERDWKERGLGKVKILRHKTTKQLRVVMRREQVHKICLNHLLNNDVEYKRKDDKSWLFAVNDYSDGHISIENLLLRFKTKEIAEHFMDTVKKALEGTAEVITDSENKSNNTSRTLDSGTTASPSQTVQMTEEEKSKIENLQLPHDFFTTQSTCEGCRGCDSENVHLKEEHNNIYVNKADIDNPLLPMVLPQLSLNKLRNPSFIKESSLTSVLAAKIINDKKSTTSEEIMSANSPISGLDTTLKNNAFVTPATTTASEIESNKSINTFSFLSAAEDAVTSSTGFVLGGLKNFTGEYTTATTPARSIFGGGTSVNENNTEKMQSVKNSNENTPSGNIFSEPSKSMTTLGQSTGSVSSLFSQSPSIFSGIKPSSIFTKSSTATTPMLFGSITSNDDNKFTSFSSVTSSTEPKPGNNDKGSGENTNTTTTAPEYVDLSKTAVASLDFATLAAKASNAPSALTTKPFSGDGFIGLTNQDAFSNFNQFKKPEKAQTTSGEITNKTQGVDNNSNEKNEDVHDPYYAPIIELPEEIVVSTGEEEEEKLFGERATLYRWDVATKEWKEKGVGELKILYHPVKKSYRMVMRREQIFKLILNHAIGNDFEFNEKKNSPKTYVWATVNYAESADGISESLAVRFKKIDTANQFSETLKKCITACSGSPKDGNN